MDARAIDPTTFNLSVKKSNGGEEVAHRHPSQIMAEIRHLDTEAASVLNRIQSLIGDPFTE